jgi:methyl-accepting chemotaxis protein
MRPYLTFGASAFRYLTLKQLIFGIGFVGIFGAMSVAFVNYRSNQSLDALRDKTKLENSVQEALAKLEKTILTARVTEKDFSILRRKTFADRNIVHLAQAARQLNDLKSQVVDLDPSLLASVTKLEPHLERYGDAFARLVEAELKLGLDENSGLEGQLRTAVQAAEAETLKDKNAALRNLVLLMRRHEKDFMLRGDTRYQVALGQRVDEFAAALSVVSDTQRRETLAGDIKQYKDSFDAFVKGKTESVAISKELIAAYSEINNFLGALIAEVNQYSEGLLATISQQRTDLERQTMVVIGSVIGLLALLAFLISRAIAQPITSIAGAMRKIANGDFAVEIPGQNRRDELGGMAKAVLFFKETGIQHAALRSEAERARLEAGHERQATMMKMADDFEASVSAVMKTVASTAIELQASAEKMSSAAQETVMQSTTVANSSEQASANVEKVAAAGNELSATTNAILQQARHSSEIANEAVDGAFATNAKMKELATAADQINTVVALIRGIAEQTNLLALNATIEAARAGEAGRGFAVVASEVKELAGQTRKATEEISTVVNSIQIATVDAAETIRQVTMTIDKMSEISTVITAAMSEQGRATAEINENVQRAAMGTSEVSLAITHVATAANVSGAAASQLLSAASELSQQSETLKSEMETFLGKARAG